jgi:hypothetical protein
MKKIILLLSAAVVLISCNKVGKDEFLLLVLQLVSKMVKQ